MIIINSVLHSLPSSSQLSSSNERIDGWTGEVTRGVTLVAYSRLEPVSGRASERAGGRAGVARAGQMQANEPRDK